MPNFGLVGGGAHLLTGEEVQESHFGRGDRHCGTLCIYVLRDEFIDACIFCIILCKVISKCDEDVTHIDNDVKEDNALQSN